MERGEAGGQTETRGHGIIMRRWFLLYVTLDQTRSRENRTNTRIRQELGVINGQGDRRESQTEEEERGCRNWFLLSKWRGRSS